MSIITKVRVVLFNVLSLNGIRRGWLRYRGLVDGPGELAADSGQLPITTEGHHGAQKA
jgi:hypothetical protein